MDGVTLQQSVKCFLVAIVHWMAPGKIMSIALGALRLKDAGTCANYARNLNEFLAGFGICHSLIRTITTDGASNMATAAMELNLPVIWCVAHLVNFTVRDAVDNDVIVAELVRKVKETVTYFKRYVKLQATLEECQSNIEKARLKLIQSVGTRWNSELDMLERFAEVFHEVSTVITGRKEAPDMVCNSNPSYQQSFRQC